ncbi:MAG: biotin--[acetyl-CoA-carboxylase] ligase [Armatimonadetes bacterium]|nr:biotin--[acetyl-CoA-carboxylase] ligase [Armatimonadota bacterium]
MWGKVIRYAEVTSTNDLARDHARRGESEGSVVVARYQTAGRGRRGRCWEAPSGTSLLASYVLRPPAYLAHSAWITLASGVAAARAAGSVSGRPVRLKWPNDVLLDGKKVGGILTEVHAGNGGNAAIVGVGINVAQQADDFPPELLPLATSLSLGAGHAVALDDVLAALNRELEEIYTGLVRGGHDVVQRAWRQLDDTLGRQVHVESAHEVFDGQATDLDDQGALWVQLEDGEARRVVAADVSICLGD